MQTVNSIQPPPRMNYIRATIHLRDAQVGVVHRASDSYASIHLLIASIHVRIHYTHVYARTVRHVRRVTAVDNDDGVAA